MRSPSVKTMALMSLCGQLLRISRTRPLSWMDRYSPRGVCLQMRSGTSLVTHLILNTSTYMRKRKKRPNGKEASRYI
jgi:hypothetical protein